VAILPLAAVGGPRHSCARVREALARWGPLASGSPRARDAPRLAAGALAGSRAGPDARTLLQLATFSADRSY
jgi:hypothetical protein